MKTVTLYVCGKCGKESKDKDEIIQCEAEHLGLTVEEYHQWKKLRTFAEDFAKRIYYCKNEEIEKLYDKAIKEYTDFEVEHNIPLTLTWI